MQPRKPSFWTFIAGELSNLSTATNLFIKIRKSKRKSDKPFQLLALIAQIEKNFPIIIAHINHHTLDKISFKNRKTIATYYFQFAKFAHQQMLDVKREITRKKPAKNPSSTYVCIAYRYYYNDVGIESGCKGHLLRCCKELDLVLDHLKKDDQMKSETEIKKFKKYCDKLTTLKKLIKKLMEQIDPIHSYYLSRSSAIDSDTLPLVHFKPHILKLAQEREEKKAAEIKSANKTASNQDEPPAKRRKLDEPPQEKMATQATNSEEKVSKLSFLTRNKNKKLNEKSMTNPSVFLATAIKLRSL